MTPDDRKYLGREAAFPPELQGEWVEDSDPTLVLILSGSEIVWRGDRKDYQDKTVLLHEDGSVSVTVEFADQVDSGDELNLVATSEGDMFAFSDHFASRYVRIAD